MPTTTATGKSFKVVRDFALTTGQREDLRGAIARAKRGNGKEVTVKGHKRLMYRLGNIQARRLARARDVELAVFRFCSDVDKRGRQGRIDDQLVEQVVEMLHNAVDSSKRQS